MAMFHPGNRALQQQFGSTALADRLVERLRRSEFNDEDREFIHSVEFFFLATAAPDGHPDCSFKGGAFGFVRVVRPDLHGLFHDRKPPRRFRCAWQET